MRTKCEADASQYIASKYNDLVSTPGDINEHLPVIYDYVKRHAHATEIGVRNAVSSWAFAKAGMDRVAEGQPFTYVASDITRQNQVDFLDRAMAGCPSIRYSFREGNDLTIEPWLTDVLMIDTWHVYRQLAAELERWGPYARRYILLHDTESFAERDEGVEGHGGKPVDDSLFQRAGNVGLWPAVEQFLAAHPEWALQERRRNNNGLTILRRAEPSLSEPAVASPSGAGPAAAGDPSQQAADPNSRLALAAHAYQGAASGASSGAVPPGPNPIPLAPFPIISGDGPAGRFKTEVVMFVPTPVPWEERRRQVHRQFEREGWAPDKAVLLFVIGTRAGDMLRDALDSSAVAEYPRATNVRVYCRDQGDQVRRARCIGVRTRL